MKCDNKKCPNDRRKNIVVFDTGMLNEMIGREVCKPNLALCKDCIPIYYGKTYEELLQIEKERTKRFEMIPVDEDSLWRKTKMKCLILMLGLYVVASIFNLYLFFVTFSGQEPFKILSALSSAVLLQRTIALIFEIKNYGIGEKQNGQVHCE